MMTDNELSNSVEARITSDQINLFPTNAAAIRRYYFRVTAAIVSVTRCVVSANMILNEYSRGATPCGGAAGAPDRISLLLDDRPPLAAEISAMGNVFQGAILISPAPHTGTWEVLNSVTS